MAKRERNGASAVSGGIACAPAAARLLEGAMRALGLSARGYARVLKFARTIADLAGEPMIGITHIAGSIQYREREWHPR